MSSGSSATSSSSGSSSACAFPDGASPSGSFAFPQNKKYSHCTYPASFDPSAVCHAYSIWYAGITTTTGAPVGRRVFDKTNDSGNTTSEGMGYGMLIAVYMSDKPAFDALWQYANHFFNDNLMSWHISSTGGVIDPHSAADADQDMAWALLMASKQWGGSPSWGGSTYLASATMMMSAILSEEITGNLPTDGDYMAPVTHPDYAAPDYNAEFATAGGGSGWNSVSGAEYTYFSQNQNGTSGLIPDASGNNTGNNIFGFDACRAPWRVGVDYCWHGTSSALSFLTPMVKTFVGLAGSTYTTNGGGLELPLTLTGTATNNTNGAAPSVTGAIDGPAAVAAMSSSANQTFIDNSLTWLAKYVPAASVAGAYGAEGDYFGSTLGLVGLLVLDGEFIDYTSPP
jgi:glycosyl hydrolase family 8